VTAASSCFELDYLLQAGEGQIDIMCRARSIESSVDNPSLDEHTRRLLGEVPRIKRYAAKSGLVPTDSYEDFVDLERPYVVWVVSAAPPLSLEPKRWWFPIVGSVPYLGWFDKHLARAQADQLAELGWDVDMRGSSAYSTLGWFDDPVLSSMIDDSADADGELANVILHESVHATIYVNGQSEVNEGLARCVGEALTVRYLTETYGPDAEQLTSWVQGELDGQRTLSRLRQAFQDLKALYASKDTPAVKLEKKKLYLANLRADIGFRRPITNATLASYDTYHGGKEAFARLLVDCLDLQRLMKIATTVTDDDFNEPQQSNLEPVIDKLSKRCKDAIAAEAKAAATAVR
jgi:predicted aminopeptidase